MWPHVILVSYFYTFIWVLLDVAPTRSSWDVPRPDGTYFIIRLLSFQSGMASMSHDDHYQELGIINKGCSKLMLSASWLLSIIETFNLRGSSWSQALRGESSGCFRSSTLVKLIWYMKVRMNEINSSGALISLIRWTPVITCFCCRGDRLNAHTHTQRNHSTTFDPFDPTQMCVYVMLSQW